VSKKIKISTSYPYTWPPKCVICEQPTNLNNTITLKFDDGIKSFRYYYFFITHNYELKFIEYPICQKHKTIAKISKALLILSGLSMLVSGPLGITYYLDEGKIHEALTFVFFFSVITCLLAYNYLPVKLKKGYYYSVIKFKNDQYAIEFEQINGLVGDERFKA
jgi:hypothetical protein